MPARTTAPAPAGAAIENGRATPTRNENDGWIRSCSEQPSHSTCCVWRARNGQKPPAPVSWTYFAMPSPSDTISSMTKPR